MYTILRVKEREKINNKCDESYDINEERSKHKYNGFKNWDVK